MSSESEQPAPPAAERGVKANDRLAGLSAFTRLGRARAGRVQLVSQPTATDCGPACLAMVLGYFGKPTPLATAREAMGGSAQGVTIRQLADGARRLGLRARAVKV